MIQGPYHVISIGILLILTYLLSLVMVRMQILLLSNHRKIWNTLLLLFFCSSAILGLFLAIRVNYKLSIPWIDRALQWHVDMGIGLAFVSLFHLSRHLGYFKKIISRDAIARSVSIMTPHLGFKTHQVKLLFLLLGFISIIAQLVLLREFIKTLHGNELVIGIFLAIWMILTSAGAWAGSGYRARISKASLLKLVLILGFFPMAVYMILIFVNRCIFLPGYEPGMINSISHIVLLIFPFTLVSGFLFSYISRAVKDNRLNANYYMLDSLGSLAGGAVFGLILVFFFDNIQVLSFLFVITVVSVILIYGYPSKVFPRIILILVGIVIFGLVQVPEIRYAVEGLRYKNETIMETKDTPYGNLTITTHDGQVTGYLDRNPVLYSVDLARAEETVHYPALQHPDPGSFLLIGGGLSGNSAEVIKYKPEIFDYCEANPWIYRMGLKHLPATVVDDFNFIDLDGRSWLIKDDSTKYDVIISAAGEPHTIGWNRYFTREFFELVNSHLSPDGIFGMQLSTGGNYINDAGSQLLSINYQTLKQVFDYVAIVPGYATYFLASGKPLSLDFPALLKEHKLSTTYVHPDYLDMSHLTFDSEQLLDRINMEQSRINSDQWPTLFFNSISIWNSKSDSNSLTYTGLLSLLVFLMLLFSYTPLKAGMYVAGFTGAGVQILLIMVVQSLYGFAYMVAPIMITIFMAGIVAGILLWKTIWHEPSPLKFTGLLWIMAIIVSVGIIVLKSDQLLTHRLQGQLVLGFLNFLPGMIVGSVYGMSLALSVKDGLSGIGRLYGADLAGAALGTFIPVVFILPLIGVTNTFILFCGINVATGLYILTRLRKR
ncbi:MAG: fused MFS/spermidine synthase [Bacteroidales bacterium]|nr:fused MFS/spermidine synthase [Bacteroidales bacterium]